MTALAVRSASVACPARAIPSTSRAGGAFPGAPATGAQFHICLRLLGDRVPTLGDSLYTHTRYAGIVVLVIRTFRDKGTRDLFNGLNTQAARKQLQKKLWPKVRPLLDQLNQAHMLSDMAQPPGNRLEQLSDGRYSGRVNEKYRVVFVWKDGTAGLPTHRPPTSPGEMVQHFLVDLGQSQAKAARALGMTTNRLNEVVKNKRGISADTALRFAAYFGTTAQFWLNVQAAWDLWNELQRSARLTLIYAAIRKRRPREVRDAAAAHFVAHGGAR